MVIYTGNTKVSNTFSVCQNSNISKANNKKNTHRIKLIGLVIIFCLQSTVLIGCKDDAEFEQIGQVSGTCWICASACAMMISYQLDHDDTMADDQDLLNWTMRFALKLQVIRINHLYLSTMYGRI